MRLQGGEVGLEKKSVHIDTLLKLNHKFFGFISIIQLPVKIETGLIKKAWITFFQNFFFKCNKFCLNILLFSDCRPVVAFHSSPNGIGSLFCKRI